MIYGIGSKFQVFDSSGKISDCVICTDYRVTYLCNIDTGMLHILAVRHTVNGVDLEWDKDELNLSVQHTGLRVIEPEESK